LPNGVRLETAFKRGHALHLAYLSVVDCILDVYKNLIEMLRPEVDMDNSDFCGKAQ